MQFKNYKFKISKFNDVTLFNKVHSIFSKLPSLEIESLSCWSVYTKDIISGSLEEIQNNIYFEAILKQKSELISRYDFRLKQGGSIAIIRKLDEYSDLVEVIIDNYTEPYFEDITKLLSLIRINLKSIDSNLGLNEFFTDTVSKHYEKREYELNKLASISESIIDEQQKYAKELHNQYLEKQTELTNEFLEKEKELNEKINLRNQELAEKQEKIEIKLKEINDRESKHERRKLRTDLKNELKNRGEKFQLTAGTIQLRKPVFYFTVILLLLFGTGLISFSILSVSELISKSTDQSTLYSLLVKQFSFAVAFGSTAVFFIKWNNRWFEQHANEEFRLKRHEIDLDRASWIVEMALEWRKENEGDLPNILIERLSQNIFIENSIEQNDLHPSEQLASAIFGAASKFTIKGPNETELSYDRKGVNRLKKDIKA